MKFETGKVLKRNIFLMLAAAIAFIVFAVLQVEALKTEYLYDITFDSAMSFFASANGIFAAVLAVFAVFMLAWKRPRADVVRGFLWALLISLLYYAMPLYSYSASVISESDIVTAVLLLMMFVPQTAAAVMTGSLLYDFGNHIRAAHKTAWISFFVSLFFVIFHIANCISAGAALVGSYAVFAQLSTVALNVSMMVFSLFLCSATIDKDAFDVLVGKKESAETKGASGHIEAEASVDDAAQESGSAESAEE